MSNELNEDKSALHFLFPHFRDLNRALLYLISSNLTLSSGINPLLWTFISFDWTLRKKDTFTNCSSYSVKHMYNIHFHSVDNIMSTVDLANTDRIPSAYKIMFPNLTVYQLHYCANPCIAFEIRTNFINLLHNSINLRITAIMRNEKNWMLFRNQAGYHTVPLMLVLLMSLRTIWTY